MHTTSDNKYNEAACHAGRFITTLLCSSIKHIAVMKGFFLFLVVGYAWSCAFALVAESGVDMDALLAIKEEMVNNEGKNSLMRNWQPGVSSHCNWTGVTCSAKHPGRVQFLLLNQTNLHGSISPYIGNLSFLQHLNLSSNNFSGAIPPSIGYLHRLKVLDIADNALSGGIPHQLGNLYNLQYLVAFQNNLKGRIPDSLCNCSNLRFLSFAYNELTGTIPRHIGSLTKLEALDFGNNSLVGNIEASIQNMTSLSILSLYSNGLRGTIPPWLGTLKNLGELYLHLNELSGRIPESIGNASSLTVIDFDVNNLQGPIPESFGTLSMLETLDLYENKLSGPIPRSLANATSMTNLELSSNLLEGVIPLSLSSLSRLEYFALYNNYLISGVSSSRQPIPILEGLQNCTNLVHIDLGINKLEGVLPSTIGMLSNNLQSLELEQNSISSHIPSSIGNLSRLIFLDLSGNQLSGHIPSNIGGMGRLQVLYLYENKLQGGIPQEITLIKDNLATLTLHSNSLSGNIPRFIGELTSLRTLDLSMNLFSGHIPSELGNCLLLENLNLSSNNLSGTIPNQVANLRSIQLSFDLSRNALTGIVPAEIGGLQMAQNIELSSNKLSGEIGLYIIDWLNVKSINLSFNTFSGMLPQSIGAKLTGLKVLDISHNNFSGNVPDSLYNLSTLEIVDFSHNSLSGRISCDGQVLEKLNHTSFLHNPMLCGNCLDLPQCPHSTPRKHRHSRLRNLIFMIVFPFIFVGICCSAVIIYICLRKKAKKKKNIYTTERHEKFMVTSKQELARATNNFSQDNILGTGSHGSVYRGVLSNGVSVAVKVFSSASQQSSEKSFLRECGLLGRIRHRNLMKIMTVCCADNFRAMVLPLMSKGSLHQLLHHRSEDGSLQPVTLQSRIRFLQELAAALSYLHNDCTPCIVHCDVKPENVLLDDDMTVKLSDFGISSTMGNSLDNSTLCLKGSIGYVAPEYGVAGNVTVKGDVYSYGVVVLEVMTRKKPTGDEFNGEMSLLQWVSIALAEDDKEKIRSVVQVEESMNEEDWQKVEGLLRVGLLCCVQTPETRPTMRQVETLLSIVSSGNVSTSRLPTLDEIIHTPQIQNETTSSQDSSTF